jgi:hypothetical protein
MMVVQTLVEDDQKGFSIFFNDTGTYVPRAVMIDLEPTTVIMEFYHPDCSLVLGLALFFLSAQNKDLMACSDRKCENICLFGTNY